MASKAFDYRTLIGKRIYLICEIEIGTANHFRICTDEITIPGEGGGLFSAGLAGFTFADEVQLFEFGASERSIRIKADLDVDIAELIAKGADLTSARASVYQWVEGTDYADKRPILVNGLVDKPSYGERGESIRFSLKSNLHDSIATYPAEKLQIKGDYLSGPARTHITHARFEGQSYPMIFGRPGNSLTGNVKPGSPAIRGDNWIIAGHRCGSAQVIAVEANVNKAQITAAVQTDTDLLGTVYSYIDINSAIASTWGITPHTDAEVYIKWPDPSFSRESIRDEGKMMRGAGEILEHFVDQAGDIEWDSGRARVVLKELDQIKLDFAITEPIEIWEWLRANLLTLAPISMVNAGSGWYPIIVDRSLSGNDPVAKVNTDRDLWDRTSDVNYEFADRKPRNSFRVEYGVDVREDGPIGATVLSAEFEESNSYIRASHARYGTAPKQAEMTVISSEAEAQKVLAYWSRIYGLPIRFFEYVAGLEWAWLRAGMIVEITDPGLHIDNQPMLIQAVEWSDEQAVGFRLAWLEDLPFDDRKV